MKQVFIVGSSSAYGVGGMQGWGDLVKQYLHDQMYGENGIGEEYEVYNFAKPGATIDFVASTFPGQLQQYGRGGEVTVLVSVGGNNAKAETEPDNFVSTPEGYREEMEALLTMLKTKADKVIIVGGGWVDETKTNPKHNPLTGGQSYFTNERRQLFRNILKELCDEHSIAIADVNVGEEAWKESYLYQDGLHPNQDGHQRMFEAVKPHLLI